MLSHIGIKTIIYQNVYKKLLFSKINVSLKSKLFLNLKNKEE